ncbi:MAG: 50S ribosomal protein L6 [Candidatus Marinimicrobia bacterium]|nr:50S ribosomal protein L6 [Candidatus Neomarinimicrobiota bacterium]MBL7067773.1 50S ribosomal protein L6 [Candidatus Neomarinimicrobiota bacterium]
MSRVGKKPIPVSENVEVTIKGHKITIKGPKGELSWEFTPEIGVIQQEKEIVVTRQSDNKTHRALHGLTRALIANMIEGVTNGFQKTLEITGVGYSAEMKGKSLWLKVGYSHPVLITPPEGIILTVPKNLTVTVSGINKQKVGQMAAKIRSVAPPEPYKGKGIRYQGEYIRRKAGKKVGVK